MAVIMIESLFKKTLLAREEGKSLLQHFQDHHVDWMQACGARGRCTTCAAIIRSGESSLGPLTKAEQKYRADGALRPGERLACQAKVSGDVTVAIPKAYRMPHITYSDEP